VSTHANALIISHNCFSKTGSNGRTLGNFFIGWPKEALAQFYINNEIPDSSVCDNYFRVTDTEVLKALYKGSRVGRIVKKETIIDDKEDVSLKNLYKKHRKRTSFNYIVRNLIWNSNKWKSRKFKEWIDEFNPNVVLLQVGDYEFMFKIALSIAKERKIPLIVYNSEDYYFKDQKSLSPMYLYYRNQFKKQFEKLMAYSAHSIYNSEMLQETYNKRFDHKSTVIMTATEITPDKIENKNKRFIISYLGNLGVGRHEPLIEVAEALREVAPGVCLDIYGKIPSEEVEQALRACNGIRLKGFVSYDEVIRVMKHSDLLVHAENFSEFYQWDLKHAFSTKIADSLASGTCLFVYAPENMACIKYLRENKSAYVITNKKDLNESLRKLMNDKNLRQSYIDNALKVVNNRHNADVNAENFKDIVCSIVKKVSGTK